MQDGFSSKAVRLVGDLPAYWGLGEDDGVGGLAGRGVGHGGEGGLDIVALGPDGDFLHGVGVGDGGFFEAVVDGDGREAIDSGDLAVAVAEAWSVAGSSGGDGVAADVNAGLDGLFEEEVFDQGVHLFGYCGVAGLEGKAGVGEEAGWVVEVVIVDAQGEVGRGGGGFSGVVAA